MMYELIKENAHLFWIGLIAVFALVVLSIYFVVRVFHKRTLPSWAVIVWLLSLVVVFFSFLLQVLRNGILGIVDVV